MKCMCKGAIVLLLTSLMAVGKSSAQSEKELAPAPEPMEAAPATEIVPQSIPGILLTPPQPLPSQTQPQTCPFTGQKLELIG